MQIYKINRARDTPTVTLTGPGDLEDGKPFPNVRLAALHARDHNRANGDGEAALRLMTVDGYLENERPIPTAKPQYLNPFSIQLPPDGD